MNIRQIIPARIKLQFRLLKRHAGDLPFISGNRMAKKQARKPALDVAVSTQQEIKKGTFLDNKIHNLKLASGAINEIYIFPNEVFSFWKLVGDPSEKRGFRKGRNIVNQKVSEETGGGLCQLSGIIYYTALKANLAILERHNHSVDIYKEEERFAPLGSDATVVYGYKDLRIRNNFPFPVKFEVSVEGTSISCFLHAGNPLAEREIVFRITEKDGKREVLTLADGKETVRSSYRKMI